MPRDIQKGIKDLPIQPSKKTAKSKKPRPAYMNEYWLYGFHLKNRYVRHMSDKYGLPYQTDPTLALHNIQYHLMIKLNMRDSYRAIMYRGKPARFIVFTEDDGRKRLHLNKFTEEQMDNIRSLLLLPEGTKPKWYNHDEKDDENAELSSEDESLSPPTSLLPASSRYHNESSVESHNGSVLDTAEDEYEDDDIDIFFASVFESDEDRESDWDEVYDEQSVPAAEVVA